MCSSDLPKGTPGSVLVELTGGTNTAAANNFAASAYLEATLRGPSFPARKIDGRANEPLLLPAIPFVGDYQLDQIRLVAGTSCQTLIGATPSSVPVRVFDEVLVSCVTSAQVRCLARMTTMNLEADSGHGDQRQSMAGNARIRIPVNLPLPQEQPAFVAHESTK